MPKEIDRPQMKKAGEVVAALRERYPGNAYAFLEEVGNATGFKCRRHADAVVMSLWPSRGLDIHGIEVKVSRSDWLRELEQPEKADEIAKYCDYWWLAVGDENIVKTGELPPTWGLLVPHKDGKLRCKVEPTKLEAQPLARSFVASVMRQASAQITDTAKMAEEFNRGYRKGEESGKLSAQYDVERWKRDYEELTKQLREFTAASGISISKWESGEKIGNAVRLVMNGAAERGRDQLLSLHAQAVRIADNIKAQIPPTEN